MVTIRIFKPLYNCGEVVSCVSYCACNMTLPDRNLVCHDFYHYTNEGAGKIGDILYDALMPRLLEDL